MEPTLAESHHRGDNHVHSLEGGAKMLRCLQVCELPGGYQLSITSPRTLK